MIKKFIVSPQFILTLITFFFAFLLPILTYAQLYPVIADAKELSQIRSLIMFNAIFSIAIGGTLTILRYISYYFDKHTLKRALISFTSIILVLLLLVSGALLSVVKGEIGGVYVSLDFGGVFSLLIIAWSLVVFKAVYHIIEIKHEFKRTRNSRLKKIRSRVLIPCPNCKYICRKQWKKCPICDSVLYED